MGADGWTEAARIYFDLRQQGLTVRSTLDCCIAVVALQHDLTLLHNDQDYERIASVRPLKHKRVDLGP
jgi:predicted nucleic acid-binding protein